MPDIKKHYKILIAILIVIILISSFIVYDITRNNVTYNNNGEPVDVKYFSVGYTFPYFKHNYTASSYYVSHNKLSYINSTIIHPEVYPYCSGCLDFGLNIHLKNVNTHYLYIYLKTSGSTLISHKFSPPSIDNATLIKCISTGHEYTMKLKIINNNIQLQPQINPIDNNTNPYFNMSITIAVNNNFYNTFDISTIRETAIYGTVQNTSSPSIDKINTSLLIENTNNSNYKIMHVRNGYFYCFLKPDTEYKLYNSNLTYIYTVKASNLTSGHSFNFEIPSSSV